jgi:hypothetical protein
MSRSWEPQPSRDSNFVRTGAKRGETVYYEKQPTSNTFTGYTGLAAEHLKRQRKYEQKRAKHPKQERAKHPKQEEARKRDEQQEEARKIYKEEQDRATKLWYEQQKIRSKSPSNCISSKYYPIELIGDDDTAKRRHYYQQARYFHPDKNTECPEEATKKMQLLHDYKALAKLGGGKSKKVSKRPSKRTTKKQSGK